MATKTKSEASEASVNPRGQVSAIEERRRAKEEATTVDGSETPSIPGFGEEPKPRD